MDLQASKKMDLLQPIDPQNWSSYVEKFNEDCDIVARAVINTQIYYKKEYHDFPVKAYGSYDSDGIIFIWKMNRTGCTVSVFSKQNDLPQLISAIERSAVIDWTNSIVFACILPNVWIKIKEMLDRKGIKNHSDEHNIHSIPKRNALSFDPWIPAGFRLKIIDPKYVDEINDMYAYRFPESELYFRGMLERRLGIGLFDENDEICAWILRGVRGDLHALHTKSIHRRKGYGQLLIKILSKIIAGSDTEVFATVYYRNEASNALFSSLGFKCMTSAYWIVAWNEDNLIKGDFNVNYDSFPYCVVQY